MTIEGNLHFVWETDARDSERGMSPIGNEDVGGLMRKLENAGNLFGVLSGRQDKEYSSQFSRKSLNGSFLSYAFFGVPMEGGANGKGPALTKGYRQVGKLLLPHYEALDRAEMLTRMHDPDWEADDKDAIEEVLSGFEGASVFYEKGVGYGALFSNEVLILNEGQLR